MTPIIHDMECLRCGYRFITPMPSPCPNCSHKYLIDWGFKKVDKE
jgi:predicted Zn-ribbon and HTH transcriptional regulator